MPQKDFLFLHIRSLPYFRAFLRAIESSYYQDLPLPSPVYDVGCGDGHFASLTFDFKLDVGLDPWRFSMREAKKYGAYKSLVEADGAHTPFPSNHFASGLSNSVLEHIPHIDDVLRETARVLQPGAPFYFCVPNTRYFSALSLTKVFGKPYENWFRKISRVHHADEPGVWEKRLDKAGFALERWWHYFSPASMRVLEWGHYFGLPSVVAKALTGKWILSPTKWNLALTEHHLKKYASPDPVEDGTFTFYIARKKGRYVSEPQTEHAPRIFHPSSFPSMPFDEHYFSTHTYADVTFAKYSMYWWSNRFYAMLARRYGRRGARLLEVGSGMGHLVGQLSGWFEAYGMDLNHWAVNQSKEAAERASLQTASAQELPYGDAVFNVVIIKHIVEHLPDPAKALNEIGRVTEPGGILVLATPNLGSLLKPWKGDKWIGYQDPTHISLKEPEEWLGLIQAAGFEFVCVFSDGFWDVPYIPLVPKQIQKLFFGSLGGLQAMTGFVFLPMRWGESIIVIARKK